MSDNIDTHVEAYNENAMIETLEYIIERLMIVCILRKI